VDPIQQLHRQGQELLNLLSGQTSDQVIPPKVLENHVAILGKTGSGKTFTAKGIVENLLEDGQRVCVLDPTGVWWGLRADPTGRKPGFPIFVFGGERGDLPLNPAQGHAIAELIGTTDTSAILDTRSLTIKERTQFFTAFAETLLRINRGPLSLILDEAHLVCPQSRPGDAAGTRMLDAANNLVSLGRGIGLRIILISQRPAKISKDSLTQAETLIVLRLIAPQDRRAVEDWIGEWADPHEGRELLRSLASLPTGEGWIWAPELGMLDYVQFPRIKSYDSSRAPDGSRRMRGIPPLDESFDLEAIRARLETETPPGRTEKRKRKNEDLTEVK
jgi:DNA helicase HerA-like ATPase